MSRYDGKTFATFTIEDGLAHNFVASISQDREGSLWFGTYGGLSQYYGETFTTFTTQDGLGHNAVLSTFQDREGLLWFATAGGGVSRYDGEVFATFTTQDGLPHNEVTSITQDREESLWFGTNGGVSRYDGETFTTFTTQDGLAHNSVSSVFQDREGALWFATWGGGVSRYDGEAFTTFTTQDGLAADRVWSIFQDQEGSLWFGTIGGVSRYEVETPSTSSSLRQGSDGRAGQAFTTFTTQDGLAENRVNSVAQDREGVLWFGTFTGGVSRYDGETFTTFTTHDGLAFNVVSSIIQDREGSLWFATLGGGVSRYDGETFTTLTTQDGLASNVVSSIIQDRVGSLWVTTDGGGVTRYRPPAPAPPPVFIDVVLADRRYESASDISIPSTVALTTFEFHGISFKTRPGAMTYRYRLRGHDSSWRNTRKHRVEYQDIPVGDYVFEVQAVDRDLTYSDWPATVKLSVFYLPISATVRISDIKVQDVFASFYKTYSEHSIGSVVVINDAPDPVEAQIGLHIPELMNRPTSKDLSLEGQSKKRVDLSAILDDGILDRVGTQSVQAEITLSSEVGEQRISVTESRDIKLYGRGSLTWEPLGKAAAFVTPEDKSVAGFSRGLYEAYRQQMKGRRVDGNIPAAMLMFEALNGHGIRYAQDTSSPYSQARANGSAIDNIQYPAELLRSRRGDCDDCTVLYCSLLENLNIPTAFIDAPDHILMMFDSGVSVQREFGFSLDRSLYVEREGRLWIPVEVTKLGEGSFLEAWELGAKTCAFLAIEGGLKITDVRDVWAEYPYAIPTIEGELDYPNADQFDQSFQASFSGLQAMRERYVEENYIDPLMMVPGDHFRQMNFAKTRIEAEEYNDAIGLLMPLLQTDYGAEAYYLIGFINAGKKNYGSAIQFMEKALEIEPNNEDYSRSVEFLRRLTVEPSKN